MHKKRECCRNQGQVWGAERAESVSGVMETLIKEEAPGGAVKKLKHVSCLLLPVSVLEENTSIFMHLDV